MLAMASKVREVEVSSEAHSCTVPSPSPTLCVGGMDTVGTVQIKKNQWGTNIAG